MLKPLAIAALCIGLAGCASTRAQVIRAEFAIESEIANRDNAEAQRRLALHHIDQNVKHELDRLNAVLDAQNARAGANTSRVAQNYIDYFGSVEELRKRTATEHETVATLNAEQVALGKGFRVLSRMADSELTVSRDTAALAVAEALRVAEAAWTEYQRRQPPPLPEPTPEPEPIIIEVPVEVPVPTPAPVEPANG